MSQRSNPNKGRGVPRFETKPWDEQATPEAGATVPLQGARREDGTVTSAGAKALAKMPRRRRFLPRAVACSPDFEPHNRNRLEYLRGRTSEIYNAWGHVSRGVAALMNAEAWLWAGSQLASERGAETGDAEHFATASKLMAQAKGLSAAAWELAEREARAKATDGAHPSAAFFEAAAEAEKEGSE